jgi:DNA-binding IclR family transcriptional regulator
LAQQVLVYLLNSVAFGKYADCCSIEDIAEQLGKKPASIRRAVTALRENGYVTVTGEVLELVYPTIAALRQQDPSLSESEAKRILKRITA